MSDVYEVVDGKIITGACELPIAQHCNMACRSCSHLSPISPKSLADPAAVHRDLSLLARVYEPRTVKLIGGEPLLHPAIPEIVAAVRASGLTSRVAVVTNGVLLWKMPAAFWQGVDWVEVSYYPGRQLTAEQLTHCTRMARTYGTSLNFKYIERFREQIATQGTHDAALVRRIFSTCEIVHRWSTHTIVDGFFYKCPPAYFIPGALDGVPEAVRRDGLRIVESPSFGRDLLGYLQSDQPLAACRRCLGTSGRLFQHHEVDRRAWVASLGRTTEELLDAEQLAHLEAGGTSDPYRIARGRLTSGVTPAV